MYVLIKKLTNKCEFKNRIIKKNINDLAFDTFNHS